jgi:hypothetical protein
MGDETGLPARGLELFPLPLLLTCVASQQDTNLQGPVRTQDDQNNTYFVMYVLNGRSGDLPTHTP